MSKRQATQSAKPRFFATPTQFRAWLGANHNSAGELWVGYYRKDSGRPSVTWAESVDEALCYGWIDGIRKKVDERSYKIRFTPRKPGSTWSAVNIGRVEALRREGRMQPPGLAAFGRRGESRSAIYSFENRERAALTAEQVQKFQEHRRAWEFFQAQPPGYRRMAAWWVISAKRAETEQTRFQRLITASHRQQRI